MNYFKLLTGILCIQLMMSVYHLQGQTEAGGSVDLSKEKEAILANYKKKINKGKLPIDGEWTDAWRNQIIIENNNVNRQYTEKYLGKKLKYGVNIAHNIKYIEPGRYNSEDGKRSIKYIDENKILIIGDLSDFMLTKVKLKDEEWFERELNYSLTLNQDIDPNPPYIVIKNVSIEPEIAAPGTPINILVDYKAADINGNSDLPVSFTYSINKNNHQLLQSDVKQLTAKSGQLMNRNILLNASTVTGSYDVIINMRYDHLEATDSIDLLISDDPMLTKPILNYKDVEGRYEVKVSTSIMIMDLISTGDGLKIHYSGPPDPLNYSFQVLSYELEGKSLKVVVKSVSKECWFTIEDEYDFSSPDVEKPLKARIIDGNWCVVIGETFKGTFKRISE